MCLCLAWLRASFEALDGWLEESRKYGADNMVVIVAATKSDQPVRKVGVTLSELKGHGN